MEMEQATIKMEQEPEPEPPTLAPIADSNSPTPDILEEQPTSTPLSSPTSEVTTETVQCSRSLPPLPQLLPRPSAFLKEEAAEGPPKQPECETEDGDGGGDPRGSVRSSVSSEMNLSISSSEDEDGGRDADAFQNLLTDSEVRDVLLEDMLKKKKKKWDDGVAEALADELVTSGPIREYLDSQRKYMIQVLDDIKERRKKGTL